MMKIAHSSLDPASGFYLVAVVGERLLEQCVVGAKLRCAGYRFSVEAVVADHSSAPVPSLALHVSCEDSPQTGMVVHPADAPLTDEELAAAVNHLLMIPRMLKAVDARGVFDRLSGMSIEESIEVRFAAALVKNVALQISRMVLPTDNGLQVSERYKAELLKAC